MGKHFHLGGFMSTGHQGTIKRAVDLLKLQGEYLNSFKRPLKIIILEKLGYLRFEYEDIGDTIEIEFGCYTAGTKGLQIRSVRVTMSPFSSPYVATERVPDILREPDPEVKKQVAELESFIYTITGSDAYQLKS